MRTTTPLLALALVTLPFVPWGTAASPDALHAVRIENFAFAPQSLTIAVGDSVEWENFDLVGHTVTEDNGRWDSGVLSFGQTFSRAFPASGVVRYHCTIHPSMTGTILVVNPTAGPDLHVLAFGVENAAPLGLSKRFSVEVENQGGGTARSSTLSLTYLYQGEERTIADLDVPALQPGASFEATVTWSTVGKVGDFAITAEADSRDDVQESDEGNNRSTLVTSVVLGGQPGLDLLDPV